MVMDKGEAFSLLEAHVRAFCGGISGPHYQALKLQMELCVREIYAKRVVPVEVHSFIQTKARQRFALPEDEWWTDPQEYYCMMAQQYAKHLFGKEVM
jgi:hypothetical protein